MILSRILTMHKESGIQDYTKSGKMPCPEFYVYNVHREENKMLIDKRIENPKLFVRYSIHSQILVHMFMKYS